MCSVQRTCDRFWQLVAGMHVRSSNQDKGGKESAAVAKLGHGMILTPNAIEGAWIRKAMA